MSFAPNAPIPAQPFPPKQGMSGGKKFVLGCGLIFGLLCLVCCGGIAYFASGYSADPVKAKAVADEVATVDLPPSFTPIFSYKGWVPGLGHIRGVMFGNKAGNAKSSAGICAFGDFENGGNTDQMQTQFEDSVNKELNKSEGNQQQKIQWEKPTVVQHSVNGKPGTFSIAQGTDANGVVAAYKASGTFQSKDGKPALFLLIIGVNEAEDENAVEQIVKSIR